MKHAQIQITDGTNFARVDVGVKDLILSVWKFGVKTQWSCEGSIEHKDQTCWEARHNRAYISMTRDGCSLELINTLMHEFPAVAPGRKISWEISLDHHREQGSRICFRFPPQDIPKLTEIINAR